MKDVFLPTTNYQKLKEMANEIMGRPMGVEMLAVTGRAGRGKTTALQRLYTDTATAVYVLYQEDWSINDLFREICFTVSGLRPIRRTQAMEILTKDLTRERRIVMVDEADRAPVRVLNAVRNLHDLTRTPIILAGEDDLHRKLGTERRLYSRLRATLAFEPLKSDDVSLFFMQAVGVGISPAQAARFATHSGGDFRVIVTDALAVERAMRVNDITRITDAIVDAVCARDPRGSK